jgi:hypothetical protein
VAVGHEKRTFNENRQRLVEVEDFHELDQPDEIRSLGLFRPQGWTPVSVIKLARKYIGYL